MNRPRDHGGGLDAAIACWGGARGGWIDLSTGINPVPYPVREVSDDAWHALPDKAAMARLEHAARKAWGVPDSAAVLAANGASALIAAMPRLAPAGRVSIIGPTYNEHAAAFAGAGWQVCETARAAKVIVHPNNPDGRLWTAADLDADLMVIDESFADVTPERTLMAHAVEPGRVILKSLGKFWGLAGLRLGFAIGDPELIAALGDMLGPWAVSGPALELGARAIGDAEWAATTRARLARDAARLDELMARHGELVGGTDLFRLYEVADAAAFQARLAERHIWSRIFPYSQTWLRLGLPAPGAWARLAAAL